VTRQGYKALSYSTGLSSCSAKHHNCFKTKFFATKIYKMLLLVLCIFLENLNSVRKEFCEVLIF